MNISTCTTVRRIYSLSRSKTAGPASLTISRSANMQNTRSGAVSAPPRRAGLSLFPLPGAGTPPAGGLPDAGLLPFAGLTACGRGGIFFCSSVLSTAFR